MSNLWAISYEDQVPVTQSDTDADPNGPFAGFYVGTSGTVKFTNNRGQTRTVPGLQAGTIYPWPITRVWSSGTGASNIFGLVGGIVSQGK